ncbi:MAG: winged helix-turn-helix domain-containing protein [Beijerinckiaceae bacterium]|nr:winged helix-turn-helix domain-containing protein [Beijerinckiaceae bacterium]
MLWIDSSARWTFDALKGDLRLDNTRVEIGARALSILEILARSSDQIVTKDEIMHQVWPGMIVEDNALQAHVSAIRKAFGDHRAMLRTVSGRGYCLSGGWRPLDEAPTRPLATSALTNALIHNLPISASGLIGRDAILENIIDLMLESRALTLIGPGGIGKSRLALEVAHRMSQNWVGQVVFVELASLFDPRLVARTVGRMLDLRFDQDSVDGAALAIALGTRRLLLVLDNCEHLIDASAELASALLRMCPNVALISTSREALRVEGEQVVVVPSLETPPASMPASANVQSYASVQLFLKRVKDIDRSYTFGAEQAAAMAALCRQLDGIPLAIELAAARAAELGVEVVLSLLGDRLKLLTGGRRSSPARHQTLRATLDWSYQLLESRERKFLRRLAIFQDSFTYEAADRIFGLVEEAKTEFSSVQCLLGLLAKSMLARDDTRGGKRLRLLETTRVYALAKLKELDEFDETARCFAALILDMCTQIAQSGGQVEVVARCGLEIDNVRSALAWALSDGGDAELGLKIVVHYIPVWLHLTLIDECHSFATLALARGDPARDFALRMRLQTVLGLGVVHASHKSALTEAGVQGALDQAQRDHDHEAQLLALWVLWSMKLRDSRLFECRQLAERYLEIARIRGSPSDLSVGMRLIGSTSHWLGDQKNSQKWYEETVSMAGSAVEQNHWIFFLFDHRCLASAMFARALLLGGLGEKADAQAKASLARAESTGHVLSICYALGFAVIPFEIMAGDLQRAEEALARLTDLAAEKNLTFWSKAALCLKGVLLVRRGEFARALDVLDRATAAVTGAGWRYYRVETKAATAEALLRLGRVAEARATIDDILEWVAETHEQSYYAELLRLRGEIEVIVDGPHSTRLAEEDFRFALDVASKQGAFYWTPRIAKSLARLMLAQDRGSEARALLADLLAGNENMADTDDWREAEALLAIAVERQDGAAAAAQKS